MKTQIEDDMFCTGLTPQRNKVLKNVRRLGGTKQKTPLIRAGLVPICTRGGNRTRTSEETGF